MRWLILLFLALTTGSALRAADVWEPRRTWVFAVGVIKFDNPRTVGWPEEGRADVEMMQVLERRGVPREQMLFLKNEAATRGNIEARFGPFLQRAEAGDTLLFYYAGHGSRDYSLASRPCTFMTYDTASRWTVDSIFGTVRENFRGRQVLYTADCCHSGVLVVETEQQKKRAAALTSAHVASTSTGNWTFTRSLIRMIEGDTALDFSKDGKITFAETARYVVDEMALLEGQHSASGTSGGFSPETVMAVTNGKPASPRVTLIEGLSRGKWWKAQVLQERGDSVYVTWPGWGKSYDEWLPKERTRPVASKIWPVGAEVAVEWRRRWWKARVIKVEHGLHLVHYEGFPEGDDEWVRAERVRERGE